jgi:hypothetical protein
LSPVTPFRLQPLPFTSHHSSSSPITPFHLSSCPISPFVSYHFLLLFLIFYYFPLLHCCFIFLLASFSLIIVIYLVSFLFIYAEGDDMVTRVKKVILRPLLLFFYLYHLIKINTVIFSLKS